MKPPDWMAKAACLGADPDMWFPDLNVVAGLRQAKEAQTVCARCPVRIDCAQFAVKEGIREGIWGGLLPQQRPDNMKRAIKHGTIGGYRAHRYRKEPPCDDCKLAHNQYNQDRYQRRATTRAGRMDPDTIVDSFFWTRDCQGCDKTFTQERRTGRPDLYCPDCQTERPDRRAERRTGQ